MSPKPERVDEKETGGVSVRVRTCACARTSANCWGHISVCVSVCKLMVCVLSHTTDTMTSTS